MEVAVQWNGILYENIKIPLITVMVVRGVFCVVNFNLTATLIHFQIKRNKGFDLLWKITILLQVHFFVDIGL